MGRTPICVLASLLVCPKLTAKPGRGRRSLGSLTRSPTQAVSGVEAPADHAPISSVLYDSFSKVFLTAAECNVRVWNADTGMRTGLSTPPTPACALPWVRVSLGHQGQQGCSASPTRPTGARTP